MQLTFQLIIIFLSSDLHQLFVFKYSIIISSVVLMEDFEYGNSSGNQQTSGIAASSSHANLDPELMAKQIKDQNQEDYQSGTNCFSRKMFLGHCLKLLVKANKQQNIRQTLSQFKLKRQDKSEVLEELFQTEITKQMKEGPLTVKGIYTAIYNCLKFSLIYVEFLMLLSVLCRIGQFIAIQHVFLKVSEENYTVAYILMAVLVVFLLGDQNVSNNYYAQSRVLTIRVRSCVISLMLKKILTLNNFTIEKEAIGKITNLISNDFNIIEYKAPFPYTLFIAPVAYIGSAVLLVVWLGPAGLICLAAPILLFPFLVALSKKNNKNLAKVNVFKDERVKIINDLIVLLRQLKAYAWEGSLQKKINELRKKQIKAYIPLILGRSLEITIANTGVYFGGFICLYIRSQTSDLTNDVIFAAIQIFTFLHYYNLMVVLGLGAIAELSAVFDRLKTVMQIQNQSMEAIQNEKIEKQKQNAPKQEAKSKETPSKQKDKKNFKDGKKNDLTLELLPAQNMSAEFKNFNGYWDKNQNPVLKNINLQIRKKHFYGLLGQVGSGKSSLLHVFLKQMPCYSGEFQLNGKISYCQQEIILFEWTIRQNILFGRTYQESKYNKIVEACCLNEDLEILKDGDATIVGQKGLTLSGGQKARVGLARALYSDADLYLFDDPLSAVDSRVGKHIFQNVFLNYLKYKTVILSTHQINFLLECDYVIAMQDGQVVSCQKPSQMETSMLQNMVKSKKNMEVDDDRGFVNTTYHEENVQLGVKFYCKYFFYKNKFLFVLSIFLFFLSSGLNFAYLRLLSYYTEQKQGQFLQSNSLYWGVLGLLEAGHIIFTFLMYFFLSLSLLINNRQLHSDMMKSMIRCKVSLLDTMHSGQLTNIFSNDIGVLDNSLFMSLQDTIYVISIVLIFMANCIQILPYFAILGGLLFIGIVVFYILTKKVIVEAKQQDLKSRTPIFTRLNQTVKGLIQIHLFSDKITFIGKFFNEINYGVKAHVFSFFLQKASDIYASYLSFIMCGVGFFIGIALIDRAQDFSIYCIMLTNTSLLAYRSLITLLNSQNLLISAVRCLKVVNFPSEPDTTTAYDSANNFSSKNPYESQQALKMDQDSPIVPSIRFNRFQMKYREGLPLTLKDVNFSIRSGEKVGIVGRTGSGKSTIIQSLIRLYEPEEGSVYQFYGRNALKMGLHTLRSQIALIPQVPFLMKATIRQNLDPEARSTDKMLWDALKECGLQDKVEKMAEKLDTYVAHPNALFSLGEKQLFCLARAMLKDCKLLLLDEATSNIDKETDEKIQKTIRKKFKSMTVIAIAHRLLTIADYDKLIVMENGMVMEIGHPYKLLQGKGHFYQMVMAADAKGKIEEKAKKHYEAGKK